MPMCRASSRATRRWPWRGRGTRRTARTGSPRGSARFGRRRPRRSGGSRPRPAGRDPRLPRSREARRRRRARSYSVAAIGSMLRVGHRPDSLDAARCRKPRRRHAEHGLQVPELVRDLRGEARLQLVVGRAKEERREDRRHDELRVKAVREDPHEALLRSSSDSAWKLSRSREKSMVEGRPLVRLPVLVERPEGPGALLEVVLLFRLERGLGDAHARLIVRR